MKVLPIDLEWAKSAFPAVFQFYGSALGRQVEAFNGVVTAAEFREEDIEFVFARLSKEFKKSHRPLLNTLTARHRRGQRSPRTPRDYRT